MISLTVGVLAVNVVALLGLAGAAWRHRSEPAARIFGVFQTTSAVWAGLTAVGLGLPPGPLRLRLWGVTTGISLLVVVLWLAFILSYIGRERWVASRWFGIAAVPLVSGAVLYFLAPTWPLFISQTSQSVITAGTVVDASIGPIGGILGMYVYFVFLAGIVLILKTVLEGNALFVGQAIAFVLGTLVTVVASVLVIVGLPVEGYPLTQVALGPQSLLLGYAVFRQQFLQVVPAVARIGERAVVDDLDEGVVVVDTTGTIIRANPRARAYFEADGLVGKPMDPVLDRMGVKALSALPTRFERRGRSYQAKCSTVTNWRGESVGQALAVRDVTPLVRRQQRLEVLNRILRHNVRNSGTVVLGIGGRLLQRDEDELAKMGEMLDRTAADLTAISEKAIEIDRIFDDTTAERVSILTLLKDVVTPLADQHPGASVRTTSDVEELLSDRRLLALVLTEVVENALVHAGDAPTVEVTVARTDEGVEISVSDDGPGIPQVEIETITAGRETDLQHASSLGLWLVSWGTQSLDGTVDITTDDDGSTVTLTLPDLAGASVDPSPANEPVSREQ